MGGTVQNLCFVCGGALANDESNWRSRKTGAAVLENNLDVIFLLRKLVKVPSIQLECQLKESGVNPEDWISLCDQCTQLIKKGRELDQEIKRIERELRLIQEKVLGEIRNDDKHEEDEEAYLDNCLLFGKKIRSFVKYNNYNQLDDKETEIEPRFLEGDQLAKYLESQEHPSTAIVLVKPCEDDNQDEIKVEQESPPGSPPPAVEDPPDHLADEDDPSYDPDETEVDNCSCSACGRKFNAPQSLQRHVKLDHNKEFHLRCPLCSKGFDRKRYLHRHLLGKHKDEPVTKKLQEETGLFLRKCSVVGCCLSFMKQAEQDRHVKRVHQQSNDKTFKCKYCDMGFWDKSKCRRHEKIHEEKGKVRGVPQKSDGGLVIKVVKDKVTLDKRFKCDSCSKSFGWARTWSYHLWNEHNKRDIICPGVECGKSFDNLVEFQKHWKSSHVINVITRKRKISKDEGQKHLCSFCGKEFRTRNRLKIHQKNQHLTKPGEKFICEICGVEKKSEDNLYQHKTAHRKGKASDKQLSGSGSKRRQTEGGEFICGFCGMKSISERSLWQHKRKVHNVGTNDLFVKAKRKNGENMLPPGEKFVCDLCGKGFSLRGNLDTHVKFVHDKKFELSCHVCGLGMASRSHLNLHLLMKHKDDEVTKVLEEEKGIKLWRCGLKGCISRFLSEGTLRKHVERFHKGSGGDIL